MKRILRMLCVSLAVCALFIALKCVCMPRVMKSAGYGPLRLQQQGEVDSLFLGSSMFRQGIDLSAFDETGEKLYMLAYNGNQPTSEYYQMEYLYDRGVRVKTLYVDMYAFSMSGLPKLSDVRLVQGMPLSFMMRLYKTNAKYGDAGIPELLEMLVQSNNELFVTSPVSMPLINKRYDRGGNVGQTKGSTKEQLDAAAVAWPDDAQVNPVQKEYLEKLVQLCRDNDMQVIFVETPKYERTYGTQAYQTIMKEYCDLVQKLQCPAVISDRTADICGAENAMVYSFDSTDAACFTDLVHLSSEGCRCFSALLRETLAQ